MKSRPVVLLFAMVLLVVSMQVAQASRTKEVTLVMVPQEETAVKVGKDLASRYPVLLLRYHVFPDGKVSFNGWTGTEWVNITTAAFRSGDFFHNGPSAALLITKDRTGLPASLIPPAEWVDSVYRISTVQTRPLLHLAGRFYDFKYKDWTWFAKRYAQPLEAINPDRINVSWYHERLSDHLVRGSEPEVSDLQYSSVIRIPAPPAPVEKKSIEPDEPIPVVAPEQTEENNDPAVEEQVETSPVPEEEAAVSARDVAEENDKAPAEEETSTALPSVPEPEDPDVNLLMGEAPAALVLGADDAEESKVKTVEDDEPQI